MRVVNLYIYIYIYIYVVPQKISNRRTNYWQLSWIFGEDLREN
jgi:hypothetical protein